MTSPVTLQVTDRARRHFQKPSFRLRPLLLSTFTVLDSSSKVQREQWLDG
jgi:hypothetical protein